MFARVSFLMPKAKAPNLPAPPSVDDAAKNTDELDRIRRRRGVLANIFGGTSNAPSAPNPATKSLLG